MASIHGINMKKGHLRMFVLLVILLALLLAPTFCLADPCDTRAPISKNYTDNLNDVLDKGTNLQTSAKPMYDISNASFSLGGISVAVRMTMASAVDRDGFYIFQCEVNGAKGYKFYFAQDAFAGLGPTGASITVSGNAVGNSVEITVSLSLLGAVSAFDLDNVSAQDGALNYIDVLDCASQRFTVQAYNAITLSIFSEKQLLLRQVTTYSDSKAMKDGMDTDKNGYVDVPESQGYAWSLQSGLNTYISDNKDTYYGSSIYLNGEPPWDIGVQVYIWIDEPAVSKADASSITIDYYMTYQDNWGSTIAVSLPSIAIAAKSEQGQSTFRMVLPEGYSIDSGATDTPLRQSVFENRSGLSMDDAELTALTDARYDVSVKTPLKDEEGTGFGIYVIIALISVTIAFCIFVGYQTWKKRQAGGGANARDRDGSKVKGRSEATGRDKGAGRGKKKGARMDAKTGRDGHEGALKDKTRGKGKAKDQGGAAKKTGKKDRSGGGK